MKNVFKLIFTILFSFGLFLPAYSSGIEFSDPVTDFRDEVASNSQLLNFNIKKISAIFPSEIINLQGRNYPGYRGPGQLVVYYPEYGETTGTNEYGTEAVIEGDMVVKLTGANSIIPKNGFVISGHGSSKKWIKNNLKIGTKIKIIDYTLIAYTTPESYLYDAKVRIEEAEEFVNNLKKTNSKMPEDKRAQYYLKKAKSEYKKAERAKESLKTSYAKSSIEMSLLAIKFSMPYIEDEFKGVWVRPKEKNEAEIKKTLDEIQAAGIKEVFLETFFHGATIYPSSVMASYSFPAQNPIFSGFDPLAVYINEAHKRNLKLHIWFESFYIGNSNPKLTKNSILALHPDWGNKNFANYNSETPVSHKTEHNGYFLDPANSEVQYFLLELLDEISTKYKIDGVNLDYTRYPTSQKSDVQNFLQSNWGYTAAAREEFFELYGIDPVEIVPDSFLWRKWCGYREDKIYDYVKAVSEILRNKNILFTAVIFPDYDVCIETKLQDWSKWSKDNLVDGVTPLILTSDNELFYKILKEVQNKISGKTKVYTGLFVGFLEAEPEDLLRQISVSRALKSEGVILFDWAHLPVKYRNVLKYRVFSPNNKK